LTRRRSERYYEGESSRSRRYEGEYNRGGGYNQQGYGRGKSPREARVERLTWALLVAVFALLQFVPDTMSIPNWLVPLSGAVILLGSGLYQYAHRWRVSPITWVAGMLLLFFTYYNFQVNPNANFLGPSLIVFAGVILIGVITGET
jgi:hypothetical protein